MEPEHPEQEYHPDPKSADKVHDSGTELNNIVMDAISDEEKTKAPTNKEFSNLPISPETPQATTEETNKYGKAPKKRGKLIALIIAIIVVLCGAGTAAGFLIWRSQPEIVAMDAMVNFFNTDTIQSNGAFTVWFDQSDPSAHAVFMFDAEGSGLTHRFSGLLTVNMSDGDVNFSLNFKEAFTKDRVLYFQIDKLHETIESLGLEFNEFVGPVLNSFTETVDLADGTWWRVSLPEVLDNFDDQLSKEQRQRYEGLYSCTLDAVERGAKNGELAQIYSEHPFVSIEKYQGDKFKNIAVANLYKVDFKVNELRDFIKADFSELTVVKDVKTCFADAEVDLNDYIDSVETSMNSSNADSLDGTFVMDIDSWSHRIMGLYFEGSDTNTGNKAQFDISFKYPKEVVVSAPEQAKPVSELIEQVFTDLSKMMYTGFDDYHEDKCSEGSKCESSY